MENQYMKQLVADFSKHLGQALEIGSESNFSNTSKDISNVVVCGLGGSGIGGTNVQKVVEGELKVPFLTNKGYHLPAFINEKSLVICCSYSGNTEETLAMYEQAKAKKAEVVVVCSGGAFEKIAQEDGLNHIIIPGGLPPRAAFGLAFPQLFFVLNQYSLIDSSFIKQFENSITLLESEEETIREKAKDVASFLKDKIAILYAEDRWEGVLVRFRQQINENSKMLAWHHVLPELNHNELVGWTKKNDQLAVILMKDESDYYRNQKRFEYTKSVVEKCTPHYREVLAKGNSLVEKCNYLIHFGDWVSYYLAEEQTIDSVEVNVITGLKNMLSGLD